MIGMLYRRGSWMLVLIAAGCGSIAGLPSAHAEGEASPDRDTGFGPQGRVTAPSDAEPTCAAYLANTPDR